LALPLFGQRPVAAMELCSHPDSYVNRLAPAADLDGGVIAASWDHVVSLASTYLPGQRDHLVLRGLHTLPLRRHTRRKWGTSCAKVVSCARPVRSVNFSDDQRHAAALRAAGQTTAQSAAKRCHKWTIVW